MPQPPVPSHQLYHIILASNSPRRRELMADAGYHFTVMPPSEDVECGVCSESGPAGLVAELAYRKAKTVWEQLQNKSLPPAANRLKSIILGADTVAECNGFILGKPRDEYDARDMLEQLSGREHRVLTGVCLFALQVDKRPDIRVAVTKLRMDQLTGPQLDDYIASGQWEGKAGAFGYQDRLGWVHVVEGSESNVVGLPMELVAEMLRNAGAVNN
ncbi:MAG: Maf family protein [Pirellulales bacterium]